MKRILIILGILVVAVAIVVIGVLLRDNGDLSGNIPGTLPQGGTLPIAGNGGNGISGPNGTNGPGTGDLPNGANGGLGGLSTGSVSVVSQAAVVDYAVNSEGVIFIATNGSVISASSSEMLGQAEFGNILGASFSPRGDWLLVKSDGDSGISWDLLDVNKKTWRNIDVSATEMHWSPNGSLLLYFSRRPSFSVLTTYAPATNTTRSLITLSAPDLVAKWKDATHVFLLDRPSSLVQGSIMELAVTDSSIREFARNVSGGDVLWGGETSGGLLFKAGPTGGVLSVVNTSGEVTQTTNFLTLIDKCFFGEKTATSSIQNIQEYLFCAIPGDQIGMRERQLPDDYHKGKFGTADTLYAINLFSGALTSLIPSSQRFSFDGTNLKTYAEDIYFINRSDKKLYKASLSPIATPEESEEPDDEEESG